MEDTNSEEVLAETIDKLDLNDDDESNDEGENKTAPSLTQERAKWLEEEVINHKQMIKEEKSVPVSKELAAEKARILEEKLYAGPIVKEHTEPVSKTMAAERAKWLMEQANKGPEVKELTTPVSRKIQQKKQNG